MPRGQGSSRSQPGPSAARPRQKNTSRWFSTKAHTPRPATGTNTATSTPSRAHSRLQSLTPGPSANRPSRSSLPSNRLNVSSIPPSPAPSVLNLQTQVPNLNDQDEDASETVLAIDARGEKLVGCAYWTGQDECLYVMQDLEKGCLDDILTIKTQVDPTVILSSARLDATALAELDPERREGSTTSDAFTMPYIFDTRPSTEFSYENGRKRLLDLAIPQLDLAGINFMAPGDDSRLGDPAEYNHVGYTLRPARALRLDTTVDMESRLSIGCAGAVLAYLQRKRASSFIPSDTAGNLAFRVTRVESFTLQGTMAINNDTLAALQIIESDWHPHPSKQGGASSSVNAKESLSVYGLFQHFAGSPQGKQTLKRMFLRPSVDLAVIEERHNTLSVLLRPDNDTSLNEIGKALRQIKNMHAVMTHLRKGSSTNTTRDNSVKSGIWSTLRNFAFHALGIRSAVVQLLGAESLDVYAEILEEFNASQLATIGRAITEIVDFQSSTETNRTVVNTNVDEELDQMKRTYDGIESLLNTVSQKVASEIPLHITLDLNVIFFPQIGFLISMPMDPSGRVSYEGGVGNDPPWERIFSTAERVYYKDYRMVELDNTFGDIFAQICDREVEILHDLAQRILEHEDMVRAVSDVCGRLDALVALAMGAKAYNLVRPRMDDENVIEIKAGRHILPEQVVSTCIPNDVFVRGGDGNSVEEIGTPALSNNANVLVMTGPNFSGKSVYLKQTALTVYLSHIGSFVPAEAARIGLTDSIHTRITTRESSVKTQSTFMIDLQQVSSALQQCTSRSLIIIDEFGKGTTPHDGAGLMYAVLEYFVSLGSNCPKVLAATHFHEIFEIEGLRDSPSVAFGHMDVLIDERAREAEEQITYLYKFKAGRSLASFGTICAALNGIDPEIVQRAEELAELIARGQDIIAACAQLPQAEYQRLVEAEQVAREFLARDLD